MKLLRRSMLDEAVRRADYLRRSSFLVGGPTGHKEWLHFCVHSGELDLLANFSMVDDMRPAVPAGTEYGRLTVLVRDGRWGGGVERYPQDECRAQGGDIGMTLGRSRVEYRGGRYALFVEMRDQPISMDLALRPVTLPAVSNNIRMDPGTPINWALVPRLLASGTATIGDQRYELHDALAYHDHNWGHFAWGRDFAWEWCYALPTDASNPWSLVFVRLNDKARLKTYMQGLFLWRGMRPHRIFRSHDIRVRHDGFLPPQPTFKIPHAMALVSPGQATDVPRHVLASGCADGDEVEFEFVSEDVAQVIIPADADDTGVTIINEVAGHLRVEGTVRGEPVRMDGPGIFEFIRD